MSLSAAEVSYQSKVPMDFTEVINDGIEEESKESSYESSKQKDLKSSGKQNSLKLSDKQLSPKVFVKKKSQKLDPIIKSKTFKNRLKYNKTHEAVDKDSDDESRIQQEQIEKLLADSKSLTADSSNISKGHSSGFSLDKFR